MKNQGYYKIHFNKAFKSFLDKNNKIINKLFHIIASYKKDIPNAYEYSINNPPSRSHYRYTDKLYISCILYITLNNMSWTCSITFIPGKQVHKRFREYIKNNYFNKLFNECIKEFVERNPKELEMISIDSTGTFNKQSIELNCRNPFYKNKKSTKITAIVSTNGLSLSVTVSDSNRHDTKLFQKVFNGIINNSNMKKKLKGSIF